MKNMSGFIIGKVLCLIVFFGCENTPSADAEKCVCQSQEDKELKDRRGLDQKMVKMLIDLEVTPKVKEEKSFKLIKWWADAHQSDFWTLFEIEQGQIEQEVEEIRKGICGALIVEASNCHQKCHFWDYPDQDSDGVCDFCDNCQLISNSEQIDSDHDGVGNACQAIKIKE